MYRRFNRIFQLFRILFWSAVLVGCYLSNPTATPQPSRLVGQSDLDLTEVWRFHTGPANAFFSTSPNLFVSNEKVILSYSAANHQYGESGNFDSLLTALSLETGQIVWQTHMADPQFGTNVVTARLQGDNLFLVYSNQVNAFDLTDGKPLWTTPSLGQHSDYEFRPWDSAESLLLHTVTASNQHDVIEIALENGSVLSRQPDIGELVQRGAIDFARKPDGLYAVDRQSGQVLWQRLELQPDYRQLNLWPSFVDYDMLFEVGAPCYEVIRVNFATGRVTWKTPNRDYLSNFALTKTRVYALREDMALVAMNLGSGKIEGSLEFGGPPAKTVCSKAGSDVYWVATDGTYVLVYFGDTQELVALKENSTP